MAEFTMLAISSLVVLEAPHTSDPSFNPAMILFDAVIQVSTGPMSHCLAQHAADRSGIRAMADCRLRPNPPGSAQELWRKLFERLAAAGNIPDELSIDSTHIKAHRSAAGPKKGKPRRRSVAHVVGEPARSMLWPMLKANQSLSWQSLHRVSRQ